MASQYSRDDRTEEDKDFFDKYSGTGESEWSRNSGIPFEDDFVLSERHYNIGSLEYGRPSLFSRNISRENHFGKGPKGYKRSDERIHDDASDALYRCYEVDATEIEVEVKDGVVHLRGEVDSRIAKRAAEIVVEHVPGVIDVQNELRIHKPRSRSHGLVRDTGMS